MSFANLRSVLASTLAILLVTAPIPASAQDVPAETRQKASKLYGEGQTKFDAGEFTAAAEAWREALEVLPETESTRPTRETIVINAATAYREAYRSEADIEQLRAGVAMLDEYVQKLETTYGEEAEPSDGVKETREELDELLRMAEPEQEEVSEPEPSPPAPEPVPVMEPPPRPDADGTGLIATGAVLLGAAAGVSPMIIVGGIGGARAADDLKLTMDEELQDSINERGDNMNAMLITASVLTGTLAAVGVTLVVLGANRRNATFALSPNAGPRYAGGTLRIRF